MKSVLSALLLCLVTVACIHAQRNAVIDEDTAVGIAINACMRDAPPARSDVNAELRGSQWHVWEQGKNCEMISTNVDAATGATDGCGVCVFM